MLAYVVIGGVNTSPAHARALGELLAGMRAKLSLIDVTDETGRYQRASDEELGAFRDALAALGIPVARRYSGGADIGAACGTLAATRRGGQDELVQLRELLDSVDERASLDLSPTRFGLLADELAAAHLLAGQRADDLLGVGGRDVQIGVRVHDVDLRDVDRPRVRRQQVADLLFGGAVLAAEVQVEARDVVGGLPARGLGSMLGPWLRRCARVRAPAMDGADGASAVWLLSGAP